MTEPAQRRKGGEGHAADVAARPGGGLAIARYFTTPEFDPFDAVEWDLRNAVITGEKGEVVFEQHNVEIPKAWSQLATSVVVSKYFRGPLGSPEREHSVRQLIGRVVRTIRGWGERQAYFAAPADADAFAAELTHLLLEQKASFNSPVWFNVGIEPQPQCSACFILSVNDTMESILGWYRNEGIIFKGGSGAGVNLSPIRSAKEKLAGGGTASGPVSFMKAAGRLGGRHQVGGQDAPRRENGGAERRPPGHRRVHPLQGRGREEGLGADRGRLRCLARRPGVRLGVLPERQQLGARDRRLHARRRRGRRVADALRPRRRARGDLQGARRPAHDRRGDARLRRSGHAVRYHHQRLAHLPEQRPHQRLEPVLGVHAPRQLGVQPGVAQPHEVRRRRRGTSTPRPSGTPSTS